MDFFGLDAQLAALPQEGGGAPADAGTTVVRAWYLRQRDTRRALAACDRAARLLGDVASPEAVAATARIALIRAEAAWLFDAGEQAQSHLGQARAGFAAIEDWVGLGDVLLCEAAVLDLQGGDSLGAIRAAAAAYAQSGDDLRIVLADTWIACIASAAAPELAAQRWNATLERARRFDHPGLDTFIEGALGSQAYQRGDLAGAVQHFERSFETALQVGQMFSAITLAQNLGIAYSTLGDDEGALQWMQRARDLVVPTGWPYASNWSLAQSASVLAGMGRAEAAQELLLQGMPLLERASGSRNYALATQILAEVALARDQPQQALEWSGRAQRAAASLGFPDLESGTLRYQAQALSRLGRAEEARTAAEAALAIAREGKQLRLEAEALHTLASIAREHGLQEPPGAAAPSAALHWLRLAFAAHARLGGAAVPHEWHAEMSQALEKGGDLAAALEQQRLATAALDQAVRRKAEALATGMQVRHRIEKARAEAAHDRALAQASQERLELLQASHLTLEQLAAIGQEITRGLDAGAVYATLARHVGSLLDAATMAVWRIDTERASRLVLVWGIEDGRPLPEATLALDDAQAHTARCLRERRELLLEADAATPPPSLAWTAQRQSALFMPLIAGDEALGVLSIQSPRDHAYGQRERQILRSLAAATAVALANSAQAERLARVQRELEHERMQGLLVHAGKMVAVGRLASGLMHEMSHPVGTLMLLADSMAEVLQVRDDPAAADARDLQREAERLAQIVRRLRNFARADGPQLALHELRTVLADARSLYGPRLAMERIDCVDSVPPLTIWADTERLSLAIANLVFNAADAMEGRADKRLWIGASQRGDRVALSVRDNGPGISAAVAARLFEPFFTTKPEGKGLGLGLAVSAESLAGMGGTITAGDAPQGGAEFTIELAADRPST